MPSLCPGLQDLVPLPQQYRPHLACTREWTPRGVTYHGHWQEGSPRSLSSPSSSPPSHDSSWEPSKPLPSRLCPPRYPYHLPFLSPPLSEGPWVPPPAPPPCRGLCWHSQGSGPIAQMCLGVGVGADHWLSDPSTSAGVQWTCGASPRPCTCTRVRQPHGLRGAGGRKADRKQGSGLLPGYGIYERSLFSKHKQSVLPAALPQSRPRRGLLCSTWASRAPRPVCLRY